MASAIVDKRISAKCENALISLGFDVIKLQQDARLGAAVCSHPDMLMHKCDDALFVTKGYYSESKNAFDKIKRLYPHITLFKTDDEYGDIYPKDVKFNLLKMGKKAFGKLDAISPELKKHLTSKGYKLIDTRQGYPACTTLPLGEKYAITADLGMEKSLTKHGVKVLKIGVGDIALPPHSYGFIGGCAAIYKDCVYFLGSIDKHKDNEAIKLFIAEAGYKAISLSDEGLADLGGIIFID